MAVSIARPVCAAALPTRECSTSQARARVWHDETASMAGGNPFMAEPGVAFRSGGERRRAATRRPTLKRVARLATRT